MSWYSGFLIIAAIVLGILFMRATRKPRREIKQWEQGEVREWHKLHR